MILIADDDNAIRLSLSMLLRKAGYEVKAVATPSDIVAAVRAAAPQLVLLDMNFMPHPATKGLRCCVR